VPLVFLVMIVRNDRAALGERTNGRLNVVGWATTIVTGAAAIGLLVTTIVW
jgi:hypothetical protein